MPIKKTHTHRRVYTAQCDLFIWMREKEYYINPSNKRAIRLFVKRSVPATIAHSGIFLLSPIPFKSKRTTYMRKSSTHNVHGPTGTVFDYTHSTDSHTILRFRWTNFMSRAHTDIVNNAHSRDISFFKILMKFFFLFSFYVAFLRIFTPIQQCFFSFFFFHWDLHFAISHSFAIWYVMAVWLTVLSGGLCVYCVPIHLAISAICIRAIEKFDDLMNCAVDR